MSTRGDGLQRSGGGAMEEKKKAFEVIDPERLQQTPAGEAACPACICILQYVYEIDSFYLSLKMHFGKYWFSSGSLTSTWKMDSNQQNINIYFRNYIDVVMLAMYLFS